MTTGSIQVAGFRTDDPDVGDTYLRDVLGLNHRVSMRGSADNFRLDGDGLRIGRLGMGRLRHSMSISMDVAEGVTRFTVCNSRRPGLTFDREHRTLQPTADRPLAIPTNLGYRCTWDSLDSDIVQLEQADLEDVAASSLEEGEQLRFAFDLSTTAAAARHWSLTCGLVRRVALANANQPDNFLLAAELTRLLAGAALVCFPNTTMRSSAVPGFSAQPSTLRRAIAYIEANADRPVMLSDIAAEAGVGARALTETFRRHLDTSPMAYLRRTRLDGVHHELLAARPGDGVTVSAVAARWGFAHLSRFGASYRTSYGQSAADTLRHIG